jgi:hypothetical protein
VINPTYVPSKNIVFFSTELSKKSGNTSELLNEHKKEMLVRGSWDFIFLKTGKIFCIRKKKYFIYLVFLLPPLLTILIIGLD